MFGHEHLPQLQETIRYRIKYIEGYIAYNAPIDSKRKYLGLDIPELLAFLKKFNRFIELSYSLVYNTQRHLKYASKIISKDRQRKAFIKDFDELLTYFYNLKEQCNKTVSYLGHMNADWFDFDNVESSYKHRNILGALSELKTLDSQIDGLLKIVNSDYTEVKKFWKYLLHLQNLFRQVAQDVIQFDKILEELGCDKEKSTWIDWNIEEHFK